VERCEGSCASGLGDDAEGFQRVRWTREWLVGDQDCSGYKLLGDGENEISDPARGQGVGGDASASASTGCSASLSAGHVARLSLGCQISRARRPHDLGVATWYGGRALCRTPLPIPPASWGCSNQPNGALPTRFDQIETVPSQAAWSLTPSSPGAVAVGERRLYSRT